MGQNQIPSAYEKHLVALGRVLQTLREEENAEVLIETTLNYLQSEFEYRLVWIGLYDRLEHRIVGKGGRTPNGNNAFLRQRFFLNPGDILEQVVIEQRPAGIPDLREEVRAGEWRKAAQEYGVQGALLFPLRHKDKCCGVAMLGSHLWGVSPRAGEKAQLSLVFGELASALYQIELEWQRSTAKQVEKPLLDVLEQIQKLPTVEQRLDTVAAVTQQFIGGTTRTNFYWYYPEKRYFWQRIGNRNHTKALTSSANPGLTVLELSDFYHTLAAGELVAIGSGKSPFRAEATTLLLSRLKTRSLLAAPILVQNELVGFLAVEGNEARIWEEAEKNYVRAAAQIVALSAGTEELETTLRQNQQDHQLISKVAEFIADNIDVQTALKQGADLLLARLGVERFLLLQPDATSESGMGNREKTSPSFSVVYQQQPTQRRPLLNSLNPLPENEWRLICGSEIPDTNEINTATVVSIENWEEDSRLAQWRETLMPLGVRSLLVCRTGSTNQSGLLILGHSSPRSWHHTERMLLPIISKQIGQLLYVLRLQNLTKLETEGHQVLQAGLKTLLSLSADPALFERSFIEFIAKTLGCPLTALLSWSPRTAKAQIAAAVFTDPRFALPKNLAIPVATDALIQEALATDGFVYYRVNELPAATKMWLSSTGIGQVLVLALHTSVYPATGILLLADYGQRTWQSHLLPAIETLVRQFAQFRYYRRLNAAIINEAKDLEQLNWYKHRCLETFHQAVAATVHRLLELDSPDPQANNLPLLRMRSSQILHQMEGTLDTLRPLLQEEQWQLKTAITSVPLASLLKRSLNLLEPLTKPRQITISVHNAGNLSVYGDRIKLECILFELILSGCYQLQAENRIDVWCVHRQDLPGQADKDTNKQAESPTSTVSNTALVELLITNKSTIDSSFFISKETSKKSELDSPVLLNDPPNLHMRICQRLMRSWGGDILFYQLENNYFLTQLLLVISN